MSLHDKMRQRAVSRDRSNGNGKNDYRTGQDCGPVRATSAQSWGAACPPGVCSADTLATNLNRQFAGDRQPCRELPYWVDATADADGNATFDDNSLVTICPTRIEVVTPDQAGFLSEFTIGNQNQVIGDPLPVAALAPGSYAIIPFVTDCIKAGLPFSITISGLAEGDVARIGLIGPAIG